MLAKGCEGWLSSIFILFSLFLMLNFVTGKSIFLVISFFCTLLLLFFIFFFRDPERSGQLSENHMLSPADGRVIDTRGRKICIFMNLTDIHVNRIPLDGHVVSVTHLAGNYKPAYTKESSGNERCIVRVETAHGAIEIIQIAGAFIRRIRSYIVAGDKVTQNQRFGVILFGSRVDVTVPENFNICVEKNQKVKAGKTIIAELKSDGRQTDIVSH